MHLQMFRVKVYPVEGPRRTTQIQFDQFHPSAVLRARIEETPAPRVYYGAQWHIGNLTTVGKDGMYFVVGRLTREERPKYQESAHRFVIEPAPVAPFTHVLLDVSSGVCGIVPNRNVGDTPYDVAKQLQRILDKGEPPTEPRVAFEVGPVSDPNEFLDYLLGAFKVNTITLKLSRPNPLDAEDLFHKPFTRLIEAAHADRGTATLSGSELDVDYVEDIVRSVSGTADDAVATVRMQKDAPRETKHLRDNPAGLEIPDISDPENRRAALELLRTEYQKIRTRDRDAS